MYVGRVRWSFVMWMGMLLASMGGCGLIGAPKITLSPRALSCSAWTAEVEVTGVRGQSVELWANGSMVQRWDGVWGHRRGTVTGRGNPYQPMAFEARVVDTEARSVSSIELEGGSLFVWIAQATLDLPAKATPVFEVRTESSCPLDGMWWRLSTATWSTQGPASERYIPVTLPVHAPGIHPVYVELYGPSSVAGRPLSVHQGVLRVGTIPDVDRDGDGDFTLRDCDDADPTVNMSVAEAFEPNGRDDNCDGRVDEGTSARDDDGDGLSEQQGDCNDADIRVHPGADESANCRDDDCDGLVDEGLTFVPLPDDPYEAADGSHQVIQQVRHLSMPLALVSRDANDEERLSFFSHDGLFDSWGIDLVASRLPAKAAYRVSIRSADGYELQTGVLLRDGDMVRLTGAGMRDDSGDYEVILSPMAGTPAGCPVELYLEAR